MHIKPIPKSLLIHTVQYIELIEDDGFTEQTQNPSITLKNVLLTPSRSQGGSRKIIDGNDEQKVYNYTLYYDVVNSSPSTSFEFKEGSIVKHDLLELTVVGIKPVYGKELHHYEVKLK